MSLPVSAMHSHIDIGSVLRTTVCELYSCLVTRPTGAAVRTAIERQVLASDAPIVMTIDFSHVALLDFSCADEIVAKLLLRYRDFEVPDRFLLFRGISDEHLDPIETVLERHALALIAWSEQGVRLCGVVSDDERRVWEGVRDAESADVGQLEARVDLSAERLRPALATLCDRRLVRRRADRYEVPGPIRTDLS
jgi:hypothetical protein